MCLMFLIWQIVEVEQGLKLSVYKIAIWKALDIFAW